MLTDVMYLCVYEVVLIQKVLYISLCVIQIKCTYNMQDVLLLITLWKWLLIDHALFDEEVVQLPGFIHINLD